MTSPKSGRTRAGIRSDDASNNRFARMTPKMTPMTELTGSPGFAAPLAGKTRSRRRAVAIELVATVTLTISLVVAATAVSLGNRSLVERPLSAASMVPLNHAHSR